MHSQFLARIARGIPIVLFAVAACRDATVATPERHDSPTSETDSTQIVGIEGDITVRVHGAGDDARRAPRAMTYHVTQTNKSGRELTVIVPKDGAMRVSRMEIDGAGRRRMFGPDGTELSIDPNRPIFKDHLPSKAGAMSVGQTATSTGTTAPLTRDVFALVRRDSAAQKRQGMMRLYGAPTARGASEQFEARTKAGAVRLLFDPSIGAITQADGRRNDNGTVHAEMSYQQVRPGLFVRNRMLIVSDNPKTSRSLTVEMTATNVRVLGGAL